MNQSYSLLYTSAYANTVVGILCSVMFGWQTSETFAMFTIINENEWQILHRAGLWKSRPLGAVWQQTESVWRIWLAISIAQHDCTTYGDSCQNYQIWNPRSRFSGHIWPAVSWVCDFQSTTYVGQKVIWVMQIACAQAQVVFCKVYASCNFELRQESVFTASVHKPNHELHVNSLNLVTRDISLLGSTTDQTCHWR